MKSQGKARKRAIQRGMRFITSLARDENCLAYLGSGLLYFCRSLATTCPDRDLAAQAFSLGRAGFSAWKSGVAKLPRESDPSLIMEYVRAYGAAEGLGIQSARTKSRLRKAARFHSAIDYLGYDPRLEAPPADIPYACACGFWSARGKRVCAHPGCGAKLIRMTRYGAWCLAFTSAYCGERYGVPLGARYRDSIRWLPVMRPYTISGRQAQQEFHDAAYAVTHVIYTLNDYGRYSLSAHWLPWEYEFLRSHLETAIAFKNPDMVGEFLDTLRAFEVGDTDEQVGRGFEFLLDTQNADGSWADWDHESIYTGFHSTWAAIDGLREFSWRGPKLLFPDLLPLLNRWALLHY